ncbi:MAG: efflux RND transporter periplasmic adaptor subunit [Bacteroidales bacterium]
MKKKIIIPTVIIAVVAVIIIIYTAAGKDKANLLEVEVQKGKFEIVVTTTGELQAESSVDITAPTELRTSRHLRFGEIKIQDLVAEGTMVDSGDYVGLLDRSEVSNSLKSAQDQLEEEEVNYRRVKMDTALTLSNLRDELINLQFNVEEAEITLEQSKFEPPATIRQAQINLDKAKRAYEQAVQNYQFRLEQAKADMREAEIDLEQRRQNVRDMEEVIEKFEIRAPARGMVIYKKENDGTRRKVGSSISPWDLVVATLPDLTTMISKTYVNEIDISKVQTGQPVRIGVDAFPEKKYTGVVTHVANIGEQLPNTDAKVFEVLIKLDGYDPILRPAMTTSNQIITDVYEDVTFVPLEAVHVDDSIPYVIQKGVKQVVVLGASNENQIIVEQGLEPGEMIYLNLPEGHEEMKIEGEELIPVIQEKILKAREEEEKRTREAEELNNRRLDRNNRGAGGRIRPGDFNPEDIPEEVRQRFMQGRARRDTTNN